MQTWGSRGDIRPFIALAEGLQAAGHEVSLVITCVDSADFNSAVSNAGVKIETIASPVIQGSENYKKIGNAIVGEANPVKQAKQIIALAFEPVEAEMFLASQRLCAENDLVIGHFFHYPLQIAAEKSGRPHVSVMLQHNSIPTRHQPPFGLPGMTNLGNRLSWWLVKSLLNKNIKGFPDRLRSTQGLKPAEDLMCDVWASRQLTLVGVSRELSRRQADWPGHYQVCGFLDMPALVLEGEVPSAIEDFLAKGEAPVYMTFGSLMPHETASQKGSIQLLMDAANLAKCRAIIQAPLWRESGFISTDMICFVDAAPHSQVFPRCKVVIHHGGAGTTQAALLAGIPSVVVAHIAEQAFWGAELRRVGVAPRWLLRRRVTARQLAVSIRQVLNSAEMSKRAKIISAAMRNEDGVSTAVRIINEKFKPQ